MIRSATRVLITLGLLALALPALADEAPSGAIKLMIGISAELDGVALDFKPSMAVLDGKKARIEIMRDEKKEMVLTMDVLPKRLPNEQVDLTVGFSLRTGKRTIAREIRLRTLLGAPGHFSVEDKAKGEFLRLDVTPTLIP